MSSVKGPEIFKGICSSEVEVWNLFEILECLFIYEVMNHFKKTDLIWSNSHNNYGNLVEVLEFC